MLKTRIHKKTKTKPYYGRSAAKSKGSGFFDSLISAVTGKVMQDAAKEVVVNVGKKAETELCNKASEKVINKIFPKEIPTEQSKLTPRAQMILNNILNRGKGTRRI